MMTKMNQMEEGAVQREFAAIKQRLAVNGSGFLISNADTLERMGITRGRLRLPLTPLAQRHHEAVEAALALAGISLAAAA